MDVVEELSSNSHRGTRGFAVHSQTGCQNGINGPEKGAFFFFFCIGASLLGLLVTVGKGVSFVAISKCELPPGTAPVSPLNHPSTGNSGVSWPTSFK